MDGLVFDDADTDVDRGATVFVDVFLGRCDVFCDSLEEAEGFPLVGTTVVVGSMVIMVSREASLPSRSSKD